MAIAVTQEWTGTPEQYYQVTEKLGLTANGPSPEGGMFHWATQIGDKIRSTDVWVDQATCEAFYKKIDAASKELGLPEPDQPPEFFEVMNYFTAGSGTEQASTTDMPTGRRATTSKETTVK